MSDQGETDQGYKDLFQRAILDPLPRDEDGEIDVSKAGSNWIDWMGEHLKISNPQQETRTGPTSDGESMDMQAVDTNELYKEVSRICAALMEKHDALAAGAEEDEGEEAVEDLNPAFVSSLSLEDFPGDPPSPELLAYVKAYCKEHKRIYDEKRVILAIMSWTAKPNEFFLGLRERILTGEPDLPSTLQKLVRNPAKKIGNYLRMGSKPRPVLPNAKFFKTRPKNTVNAWYFDRFQGKIPKGAVFYPCYAGESAKPKYLAHRQRNDAATSMLAYVRDKADWNEPLISSQSKAASDTKNTLIGRFHLYEAELQNLPREDAAANTTTILNEGWTLVRGPSKTGDPLVDDYQEILSVCFAGGLNKRVGGKMALVELPPHVTKRIKCLDDVRDFVQMVGDTASIQLLTQLERRVAYACLMLGAPVIKLDFEANMMDLYDRDFICNDPRLHVRGLPGGLLGQRPAKFPRAAKHLEELFLARCETKPIVLALGTAAFTSIIQILEPLAVGPIAIEKHGLQRGHTQVIEIKGGGRIQLTLLNNPGSLRYAQDINIAATELAYHIGRAIHGGQAFLQYPNIVDESS